MVKKRLIFTLLMQDDIFMLSRNFRLQEVGDLDWLRENYDINSLLYSIDELIVINVNRGEKNLLKFNANLSELVRNCFMPVAAGGGIQSDDDVYSILKSGADKVVINSLLFTNPIMVERIIKRFGSQCVVASVDYKLIDNERFVFIGNGSLNSSLKLSTAIQKIIELGVGELYITSIDKDGTGQGYDIAGISEITCFSKVPVIASGGVGKFDQFYDGINLAKADAVSTANLFYFMGDALTEAREILKSNGLSMAVW
ncbi:MAG: imidazole glycerol phosphate synthase subunit HisF [Bacteroidales bacterium]|nr:imidazole glycerol phosphate synthase subunit HisF [Bacteroidales bacterium]